MEFDRRPSTVTIKVIITVNKHVFNYVKIICFKNMIILIIINLDHPAINNESVKLSPLHLIL